MLLLNQNTRIKKIKLFLILLILLALTSCNIQSVSDEINIININEEDEEIGFAESEQSETETEIESEMNNSTLATPALTASIASSEEKEESEEKTEQTSISTTVTTTASVLIEPTELIEEEEAPAEEPVTDIKDVIETPAPLPPREPAVLTKEALLEDFDYLTRTLEESFPFYGTARRKFGLDLHRQKSFARNAVGNINTARSDSQILRDFADIISNHIVSPMRTMGHLLGLWAGSSRYDIQLALIKLDGSYEIPWYPNLYANHLNRMFTSPTAVRYYGNPLENVDLDSYVQSILFTPTPNNVTFNIIQPGSVAYIRMRSMSTANAAHDGELIAAFAETIGDFDHLIVDLRGNQGGSANNFLRYIIAPLIDEPASLYYYVFFKGGEHVLQFDDIYHRDVQWQFDNGLTLHADAARFPVSDILSSLPGANADDFASLRYGFKRELTVRPAANRWAFDGRLWILIDGGSYSAAEISAALAKESGVATVVGAPTFGSFGGYTAAFIGLPNTGVIIRYDYGYVTDLQGRSLEEFGVIPHIYNRPGMDALATALAVIAEGN
jgi:hypothetical protein